MIMHPDKDGIEHINIYSKGKTELGRFLSNFTHTPINIEQYGSFESIEGLWYWLGTRNNELRNLYGFMAKKVGRESKNTITLPSQEFQSIIKSAIRHKINSYPRMRQEFIASTLPFMHYYVFGNPPVIRDAGFKWLVIYFESLRKELENDNSCSK